MSNAPRLTLDFESRSACSIRNSGTWRYSLDPTTEVLCMAYRLSHWAEGRTGLWHPAHKNIGVPELFNMDEMEEVISWIASGGIVEAHNAWFERGIWTNIMVPRFGWDPIPRNSWRCSAAKAAAHALPRALEDLAVVLAAREQKDEAGSKVMKKMAKPRKARKAEREEAEDLGVELPVLYFENLELFTTLCDYCRQDVLAEEAVSERLPDLDENETRVYLLDQTMNERGYALDPEAIDAALVVAGEETRRFNEELAVVSNGYVEKATQRENLKVWLASEGLVLPDTKKLTISETLENPYMMAGASPAAVRALAILGEVGRSSTAKYVKMRDWICPDGRAHGGLLYHGASTGRWAGVGIQPQNFPKGKIKDIEDAWRLIKTRSRDAMLAKYANVMELLSHALRGALIAPGGMDLFVADYAAIEARVLLWMADHEEGLEIFRRGEDIYCAMAESIYEYPCTKEGQPDERALGKVAVLGLGYQMGWNKFIDTCWVMARIEIDEELSRRTVDAYRERFSAVKQMWYAQEETAIEAVETGEPLVCGKVIWCMSEDADGEFLYCELPSGRRLCYPDPRIKAKRMPWGDIRPALTFMGIDSRTKQWRRQDTYGGMLVENIDQAISRDLMAAALLRCEDSPIYEPFLSVHDELLALAPEGTGNVRAFEQMMAEVPAWGEGCPVAAEGWSGKRYRK